MKHSQDISSQVMIEVGLALSMAFFSLFVLALISLNTSKISQLMTNEHQNSSSPINLSIQGANSKKQQNEKSKNTDTSLDKVVNKTIYIFYNGLSFYDQSLKIIDIDSLAFDVPIVVAAPDNLPLIELISLQKRINHPNASITNLTEDWLNAMEQLP